ncbi:hypothetical protein IM697_43000 [Streptomyces ferrugineus]|uniref:Uncharacterized protein n=1 Tax=Streptomyces ferrugineus TaxID=1413221 RepID=A0A7M2SLS8_9ACTN|nr:hypothetical protein [Streptomyces ferrugineus]QOV36665.1 hypothetical protein IM697_43000 [Streptomyces ferrugineus]
MTVASTGKTIEAAEDTEGDDTPIDVEAISSRTNTVLGLRMDTTTRAAMDRQVPAVAGDLNRLLREDLGVDDDNEVRQLLCQGTRLVDLTNRPTAETPAFGTYLYLRDVALLTQRLLWIYVERNGLDAP